MPCFYSCVYWDCLCDHLKNVSWEDIFKLSASSAASEICERVQVGIAVYVPHHKYKVKLHSSPWFSAASAIAIVHRNHFSFVPIEKNFEASKLTYTNKTK